MGFFKKIIDGLKKTQQNIGFQIKKLFKVGIFNDDFYENLEEILLTSDVGAQATEEIVDNLKEKIRQTKTVDEENATRLLKEALSDVLGDEQFQTDYPCVILVVGVNGVGKTTTIGKLARNFVREGKSVVLAAADTFRAAAGEQLEIWAKRADVRIIKHEEGSEADVEQARLTTLLSGEYDNCNAILTFHAGAGGTEAQDWTQMLYRMYMQWANKHGFEFEMMDYIDGEEAGIKSATVMVKGENAYGYLKSENGVHRLVRVSPFDANARRQTSFAALEVMPELPNDIEVDIRPEDIEMQVYRSSGAGGQHVNKTSSAVRLIHIPTGIVTACQTQRSQFQNRDYAMQMLKSKLMELKIQQHAEKISDLKGVQLKIEWGSQIRSYVFMPYQLVKDTRTDYETGNIQAVMDGDLDGFINAYLTKAANGKLKK